VNCQNTIGSTKDMPIAALRQSADKRSASPLSTGDVLSMMAMGIGFDLI
jgi:hypothetical protein